jgi:hypothetical protein
VLPIPGVLELEAAPYPPSEPPVPMTWAEADEVARKRAVPIVKTPQ